MNNPLKRPRNWLDIALYALLAVVLIQWFNRGTSGPKEDTAAPSFALPVANDPSRKVSLEALRGHPVVIEVFASWCSACRTMAPRMAELEQAPRSGQARFLAIAVDTPLSDAQAVKSDWQLPFDVLLGDSAFSSNFGIKVLPTIIVIDAEGRVAHVTTGVTRASKIDGWLAELGAPRK